MNGTRRAKLESIALELDGVIAEEQEAFDNIPDGLQDSEKGEAMEDNIDRMNEAKDIIEELAGI